MSDLHRYIVPSNGKASLTEVTNLVPECLSEKFASVNAIHRHNLRGTQRKLSILPLNTEDLKKSFRYRGACAIIWNNLSAEAKQVTTLNSFILLLQIRNYFYST